MSELNIVAIIPARMGSSRFPGKPLKEILGIPMIGHVYYRCKMSNLIDDVYVATCDREIQSYVHSISGKCIMTSSKHERASDRVAEALSIIENDTKTRIDIVVMLQGDEPMITPNMIDTAVNPMLSDSDINVCNLMTEIDNLDEHRDLNEVKVVVDKNNFALYFSRQPVPTLKKISKKNLPFKQVCVIPFRRNCLLSYNGLEPTPLEIIESVDMNRFLEYGIKVKMILVKQKTYAVDTQNDLDFVEKAMRDDELLNIYGYK